MGKKRSAIFFKTAITALSFDTTNPREINKEVVAKVLLSLKKLGLLMPIIAFNDGIILGGHQRIKALRSDNQKFVYVNFLKTSVKAERMTINMALNRVIQEMDYDELNVQPINEHDLEQIRQLEDIDDYTLQLKNVQFGEVRVDNTTVNTNLTLMEKYLYGKGVRLPVIVNEDKKVIIGRQRAMFYMNKGKSVPYIMVDKKREPFVAKAMKGISNKFEFLDKDYLRTSSRRHIINNNISGHRYLLGEYKPSMNFSIYAESVKRRLGNNILDFGAGNGKQTAYLRQSGVKITTFEPFVPSSTINGESSLSILKTKINYESFLAELSKNEPFTTVVANAVLNSVAIKDDIYKVCYLLRSLAIGGRLLGSTRSINVQDNNKSGFELGERRRLSYGMGKLKVQNFINEEQLLQYMGVIPQKMVLHSNYLYYTVKDECMDVSLSYLDQCIDTEFCFNYGDRVLDYRAETKRIMRLRLSKFQEMNLCKIVE